MNPDQLRRLLDDAATVAWDDEVRASSAVYAGKQRVRRRHRRERSAAAVVVALVAGAGVIALVPTASKPSTHVVLGCAEGLGTQGSGLVSGGVQGVTLEVDNPTGSVLPVTSGGLTVLALPGSSQVTLPLSAGTAVVRCGAGASLQLSVAQLGAQAHCTSVGTAFDSEVVSGQLTDLTASQLGVLPAGATVDSSTSSGSPLRRVQIRSSGRVVAEALWHAMPGHDDWQLESLSRCS